MDIRGRSLRERHEDFFFRTIYQGQPRLLAYVQVFPVNRRAAVIRNDFEMVG